VYIDKHGHEHRVQPQDRGLEDVYIDEDGDDADFASDSDEEAYGGDGDGDGDGGGMGKMFTPFALERVDAATQNERGLGGGVNWAGKVCGVGCGRCWPLCMLFYVM
jgi:hypothetical protein